MNDLVAFDDLDEFGAEIATPLQGLEQDLYHRLIETRGSNLSDPTRGLGIEDALSGPVDRDLAARIETEFLNDPRVRKVQATVTEIEGGDSNAGGSLRIEIEVEADEGELALGFVLSPTTGLTRST